MRRTVLLASVVVVTACGRVGFDPFGIVGDGGNGDDALGGDDDAPADAGEDFTDLNDNMNGGFVGVPLTTSIYAADPQITIDRLELWTTGPDAAYQLQHSYRASTSVAFPTTIANPPWTQVDDTDPALTADGLTLMFLRGRTLMQATRSALGQEFSPPAEVSGFEAITVGSFDISPNGLTLFWELDYFSGDVRRSTRSSRTGPFGSPTLGYIPPSIDVSFFSIGPDEKLAFGDYNDAGTIRLKWLSRPTTADAWIDHGFVDVGCGASTPIDADISADGHTLAVRCNDVLIFER